MNTSHISRSRWAAIGAAVAVCLGAGGIGLTQAATTSGERAIYKPIEPCRLIDTRADTTVGNRSTPLGAGDITLSGWGSVGNCTLPNGTAGLSLNVTAISPTLPTFLTLYPTGTVRADASHLNPVPGDFATPNAVNIDLNGTGQFNVFNLQGSVDLIIDVVGLYDDHNHDDRYYTKAEVDGAIASGGTPGEFYTEDEVDTLLDAKADESVLPFAVSSEPVVEVLLGTALNPAQVVVSVPVNAPADGTVLLNYSTYIVPSNAADPAWAGCSVGTDSTINLDSQGATVEEGVRSTLSGTRLVEVTAGTTTFNMVCDTLAGTSGTGTTKAAHPTLTAIYTPAP
jgi:hypothetical protein